MLSLTAHAAAIAAFIVVPLLHAEAQLPGFAVINAALIAPPAIPVVPPGRSGRPGGGSAGPEKGPKNPPPRGARGFIAPIAIPTEIIDEDLNDFVHESWGDPGVPDSPGENGDGPWNFGKDIVPEEIKPMENPAWTIRPPRLIKRVSPNYPPAALAARISGSVVIMAVTDIYGRVREAHVENGNALLSPAALEAVRGWIYEPHLVNGIPRPVSFRVTVTFSLENR